MLDAFIHFPTILRDLTINETIHLTQLRGHPAVKGPLRLRVLSRAREFQGNLGRAGTAKEHWVSEAAGVTG